MNNLPPIDRVFARLRAILEPRERMNVWQWADRYRRFQKGVAAKSLHGDASYCSSDAPHQRKPQESVTDPEVQMTVFIGASQIMGKTEILINIIGYHMDYKPTPMVVMYPTIETAEKFSKKKLSPAIMATPVLRDLVTSRSRNSDNTILVKDFVGGSIFIVGSNSTSSLRGASGAVLIGDEIDDYEEDIGGQGDPVELLWKRGESFPNVVKILSSTPTIHGLSRIWSAFETSDQQFWFMPCVHCGTKIIFKWSPRSKLPEHLPHALIEWPGDDTRSAVLVCQQCSNSINDAQRREMYFAGDWQPTAPFRGIRGFHLNWLYTPWKAHKGFDNRLHEMAEEWTRAKKKGKQAIKVIINTGICECFEEETEKPPDFSGLMLRCESYPLIPESVVYLTCSVDTQSDRLEYEILGWGVGEESWGIETGKLFGNPHLPEVWGKLDELLNRTFDHPIGVKLRISCAVIDSGGQTDNRAFSKPVYSFVKRRQVRYVFASKGSSDLGSPLVAGRLQKNGIMLQHIGTDVAKSTVYERIGIQGQGHGYMHFPVGRGYDEEWFKQLTAEAVIKAKGKRQWVKMRARNEALDLRAGNLAAFEIRNPNLEAIAANLQKSAATNRAIEESVVPVAKPTINIEKKPEPPAPKIVHRRRRIGFAKW